MTDKALPWQTYLQTLVIAQREHAQRLNQQLVDIAAGFDSSLAEFVFLPDQQSHSHYEDAAEVFAQAFEQMQLRKPLLVGEIPLLFIGYHVANRLTGKRFAQGFLLTDQALYAQDDFSVVSVDPLPVCYALPERTVDASSFVAHAAGRYQGWKDWASLAGTTQESIAAQVKDSLIQALYVLLRHHQQHGTLQTVAPVTLSVAQVIKEHELDGSLLNPDNAADAKKIGKLIKKFEIAENEKLQFAWAEFPLFGGPYGLALTDKYLHSKDLMESPVQFALSELDERSLHLSDGGKELQSNASRPITIPANAKPSSKTAVLDLLRQEIGRIKHTQA